MTSDVLFRYSNYFLNFILLYFLYLLLHYQLFGQDLSDAIIGFYLNCLSEVKLYFTKLSMESRSWQTETFFFW
jgi:hypothetical protein